MNAPMSDPAVTGGRSNAFSIAAIVCGVIAVLIFPIVFGPIGIILAAVAKSRNEPRANTALIVAIVGTIVGFLLGFIVFEASND
jgi:uncharacterized protein YacL